MKKYRNVWVVYVHYKPLFSTIPEPTGWEKFDGKKDADAYYKSATDRPDVDNVEAPRLYRYYPLGTI